MTKEDLIKLDLFEVILLLQNSGVDFVSIGDKEINISAISGKKLKSELENVDINVDFQPLKKYFSISLQFKNNSKDLN